MGRYKKSQFVNAMDLFAHFTPEQRAASQARLKELLLEELTLTDLRKAHALTQVKVARKLGIGQEHVSRLEQRTDMLLSTLAGYVEAMGGKLTLIAEFPGRGAATIALGDVFWAETPRKPAPRLRSGHKRKTASARRAKAEPVG